MTETVDAVVNDIRSRLNASVTATSLAMVGLRLVHDRFAGSSAILSEDNPDPRVFIGAGDPSDPSTKAHAGGIQLSKILELTERDGDASVVLGQQWLVAFYQDWEDDLRPRLASALGIPTNRIDEPVFGDLRLMRHDIIHKGGIATPRNTGRCRVLHWFSAGERIRVRDEHFRELQEAVGNSGMLML
ncbi:MAG: hypothetical protein ACJ71Z_13240 [Aeromicrobium sp.]